MSVSRIGYITTTQDGDRADPAQADIVGSDGYDAVAEPSHRDLDLTGLDVLWVNSVYMGFNFSFDHGVSDWMAKGGVLVIDDQSPAVDPLAPFDEIHGPLGRESPEQVDFVYATSPLAHGPGGTLDDASFDNIDVRTGIWDSHHESVDYDISNSTLSERNSIQDKEFAFLMTADDPSLAATVLVAYGKGFEISTGMDVANLMAGEATGDTPADLGASVNAFAANEIAYAATLNALPDIELGAGAATYVGGAAAENIFAGDQSDDITGGGGDDLVHAGDGGDTVSGGAGNNIIWGDDGDDVLRGGAGSDQIWGGAGADRIAGGGGHEFLTGGTGNDTMSGGGGNDVLLGGDGDDRLDGGDGADTLVGGLGSDLFTGGAGADVFYFGEEHVATTQVQHEHITDFQHGLDRIDLSAAAVRVVSAFDGAAGEVTIGSDAGGNLIQIDRDGDRVADYLIQVDDADHSLTAADLVF